MRVRVDEARRRDQARRIDFGVGARLAERAELRNPAAAHADLAVAARRFGAVDDGRVADDQVVMRRELGMAG